MPAARRGGPVPDRELEGAHLEAGRSPCRRVGRGHGHGQEGLAGRAIGRLPAGQGDLRPLARTQVRQVERRPGDLDAIHGQAVPGAEPAEIGEMLVVGDLDPAAGEVGR